MFLRVAFNYNKLVDKASVMIGHTLNCRDSCLALTHFVIQSTILSAGQVSEGDRLLNVHHKISVSSSGKITMWILNLHMIYD